VQFEVRDDWELWEHLIHRLKIRPSEHLLDLGTQTGHLPRSVVRQRGFAGRVVGIDWSYEMIQEAQRQSRLEGTASKVQFLCQNVQEPLPFPDNSFTLVTSVTGLLEALRDPEDLFREIYRVLLVPGRVVFSFEIRPLRPMNIRTIEWITDRLTKLGFTHLQTIPWTTTHKLVIFELAEKP
jgi:ubiquinone/menaquinone biosynthesis C-methylase UbiE